MLLIVDGTGDMNDNIYKAEMANSFCKQLESMESGIYFRGPSVDGLRTFEKSKTVVRYIKEGIRGGYKGKLYLAGHSRGGAAVIYAAQILKQLNIDVEAMFLYDAVDRTLDFGINVSKVSSNVKRCYHARRFPHLADHFKKDVEKALQEWEKALSTDPRGAMTRVKGIAYENIRIKDLITRQFSRSEQITEIGYQSIDFGNCGTSGEGACRYSQKFFLGTHGAIGGAPDIKHNIEELSKIDNTAVADVRSWMNSALAREGLLQLGVK